jgi:glycosyltransferase involved in cell wall biosynthesis
MDTFLFYLAAVTFLLALLSTFPFFLGYCRIPSLKDVNIPLPPDTPLPKVFIIVPARNEERDIEKALQSLLNQDYENMEILFVDDRSSDRTGQILDAIGADNPKIKVIHITQLPEGWLGKNHALYCGAQQAQGQFLLFTDADIIMTPTTVRRAITYAMAEKIDHLALWPEVKMPNWLLNSFVIAFTMFFNAWVRPWKAEDPKSRAHVGIGAFNLIRAQTYSAVGTHKAIAMRPDDDIKLGKIVKQHGFRQKMLNGVGLITVPWYPSLTELINGLSKNPSAAVNYNIPAMAAAPLLILIFAFWPFIAMFLTAGPARLLYAATALIYLMLGWITAGILKIERSSALGFPLAVLLHVYILWRATLLIIINNGINWRGTHYPLAELKANKI